MIVQITTHLYHQIRQENIVISTSETLAVMIPIQILEVVMRVEQKFVARNLMKSNVNEYI